MKFPVVVMFAILFPFSVLIAEEVPGTEGIFATFSQTGGSFINVVENTDGTDGGVEKLLGNLKDVPFYKIGKKNGLISANDIILIKINSQWAERGGTNTDLLKGIIQYILKHPDGFKGEIIVADNGQAMFGSENRGGRLDWASPNAKDKKQSAIMVVKEFETSGNKVSGVSWDTFTKKRVSEFENGDINDGFVVESGAKNTGMRIRYAKFSTKYGTRISFKKGIWKEADKNYDSALLKVINVPVLKSNFQYHVVGAIESYMGTASNAVTDLAPQKSIFEGGMGSQMVYTRFPTLNILDMIYIEPNKGPPSSYSSALQKNMIAASTDPVALDYWACKNVLLPEVKDSARAKMMSPDSTQQRSFGYWLKKSLAEINNAGIPAVMDESKITVFKIQ
jgi:uncharacterized protein (DUF362 family)